MMTTTSGNTNVSDSALVRGFITGNRRMQQLCYVKCRETFRRMFSDTGPFTTMLDELLHESFEVLWIRMERGSIVPTPAGVRLRHADGSLEPVADLTGAFFAGIVRMRFRSYCSRKKLMIPAHPAITEAMLREIPTEENDEDTETQKSILILEALNSLPPSCVEILTMYYHEEKSLTEILEARSANKSYNGLKTRKKKCLDNLKERIIKSFKAHGLNCP